MADLPTQFWGGWIATLTFVSLAALVWLVISVYFSPKHKDEEVSPVWDETLSEGSNPAPMWWFWFLFAALVCSVIYLMLYPGMGRFSGILKWSQGGRLAESSLVFEETYKLSRSAIVALPIEALHNDNQAMATAERIFTQHCAACHGPQAGGQANLFPNLRDADWQWGGSHAQIEESIRRGRRPMMVPWAPIIDAQGIDKLTDYVVSLNAGAGAQSDGAVLFGQYCAGCHMADGKGMQALGAPNLTDEIWLYGGERAQIHASIASGRMGVMPAFEARLDDAQIRLLTAWLTKPAE